MSRAKPVTLERLLAQRTIEAGGCWRVSRSRRPIAWVIEERRVMVRRLAHEWLVGPLDGQLMVCACGHVWCVNPAHWRIETIADRGRRSHQSARQRYGEAAMQRRYTEGARRGGKLDMAKAREIRRRHAAGESLRAIARDFGVTFVNISHVVRNKTWRE